jgi:hypothetical protein
MGALRRRTDAEAIIKGLEMEGISFFFIERRKKKRQ